MNGMRELWAWSFRVRNRSAPGGESIDWVKRPLERSKMRLRMTEWAKKAVVGKTENCAREDNSKNYCAECCDDLGVTAIRA